MYYDRTSCWRMEKKSGRDVWRQKQWRRGGVKDQKQSAKGHSETSNHPLQRQMGTNHLQSKISDTKTTHSLFFLSLSKLGFPSGFEFVIIFLFKETKEHAVYLLSFHLSFIYLPPNIPLLFLHI